MVNYLISIQIKLRLYVTFRFILMIHLADLYVLKDIVFTL